MKLNRKLFKTAHTSTHLNYKKKY